MKNELLKQADDILARSKRVAERYVTLQEQNTKLKSEVESLRQELKTKQKQLEEVEQSMKVINIGNAALQNSEDTQELKKKLNEYIREVDRCINFIKAI